MTRQQKTPAQRAQEALDVEERRVKHLAAQHKKAQAKATEYQDELEAATARRDFLRKHPDLPKKTTTTTGTGSPATTTPGGTA